MLAYVYAFTDIKACVCLSHGSGINDLLRTKVHSKRNSNRSPHSEMLLSQVFDHHIYLGSFQLSSTGMKTPSKGRWEKWSCSPGLPSKSCPDWFALWPGRVIGQWGMGENQIVFCLRARK